MVTKAPKRSRNTMTIASRITIVVRRLLDVHSGQVHVLSTKIVHVKNVGDVQVSEAYGASQTD